uniref:Fringe n=1 Tax=Macrostomum lignano TaxID=282301 RepID=A0A1I8F7H4_9PLAT
KTWMSLDYAEKNFDLDQFDFIFKADDDTFAAEFCRPKVQVQRDANRPYMSGGAGSCLKGLGVEFIDSRDSSGLERFHPLTPEYMIGWGAMPMPNVTAAAVSKVSATFHYISQIEMYKMEFLLYGMSPIGVRLPVTETRQAMKLLRGTCHSSVCGASVAGSGCHADASPNRQELLKIVKDGIRRGDEAGCPASSIRMKSSKAIEPAPKRLRARRWRHFRRLSIRCGPPPARHRWLSNPYSCPTPLSPDSGRPQACTPSCFHGNDNFLPSKLLRFSRT